MKKISKIFQIIGVCGALITLTLVMISCSQNKVNQISIADIQYKNAMALENAYANAYTKIYDSLVNKKMSLNQHLIEINNNNK